MALFSFTDLRFKTATRSGFGAVGNLVGDRKYDTQLLRYPADLGSSDKGHYMVIYIRQQKSSQIKGKELGESAIPITKGASPASQTLGANIGKASGAFGGDLLSKVNGGLNSINSSSNARLALLSSILFKLYFLVFSSS